MENIHISDKGTGTERAFPPGHNKPMKKTCAYKKKKSRLQANRSVCVCVCVCVYRFISPGGNLNVNTHRLMGTRVTVGT